MIPEIQNTIAKLTNFAALDIAELLEIGTIKTYKPTAYFLRAGQVPAKFGFVISGLFRYVYMSEEGKEFTKVFMPEKSFISSYSAMISKKPSYFFIESLEPSEVLVIAYEDWEKLRRTNPKWNLLLVKLLEKGYAVKEKREREFLLLDSETRYKIFLEEYPDLEKRVRQFMIASYLGITPVALSRIRKKING
ncbi:Crp/Fnr family transcriptional regulator [Fulvivirgaceae bacterium BMA12]|uniref:Crp/Fnr family transcriptional regulator n=1 Tax=Agaribacillus aureus TaxID=3051825 RepID=A0ABT8L5D5_9BACT|nr:Crp/Fnr family transcriptional regulator [Fulvivirgaceae bacterium BMA12]